jgi:hypothetical protein
MAHDRVKDESRGAFEIAVFDSRPELAANAGYRRGPPKMAVNHELSRLESTLSDKRKKVRQLLGALTRSRCRSRETPCSQSIGG